MQRLLLGGAHLHARRQVQHEMPQQRVERFRLLRRLREDEDRPGDARRKLEWTPKLLEIIYADPLCGACDVGCKRNLDLEIELTLEALRVKAVKDGAGPMPAHKKIAAEHRERRTTSSARPTQTGRNGSRKTSKWRQRPTRSTSSDAPHPTGTRDRPVDGQDTQRLGHAFHAHAGRMVLRQHPLLRRHDR